MSFLLFLSGEVALVTGTTFFQLDVTLSTSINLFKDTDTVQIFGTNTGKADIELGLYTLLSDDAKATFLSGDSKGLTGLKVIATVAASPLLEITQYANGK